MLSIDDVIPEGTFFGDVTPQQYAAVRYVEELGNWLIENHPEIAEVYKSGGDPCTYLGVAQQFLTCAKAFPEVASKATGYAIRRLISPEELARINKARSSKRLEELFGGYDTEIFREHCSKAAVKRHELGLGVDTDAMVRGRGRTPWSTAERKAALELANNPGYQHQTGSHRGTPDYELIAKTLNSIYHHGEPTRYGNSTASMIKDTRRKK